MYGRFAKYLVRLDDAFPSMPILKWQWFEHLLDTYQIKPIVAVIPFNQDKSLRSEKEDPEFWDKVRSWQDKGWCIALHGYNHCTTSQCAGLVPINPFSEFAGLSLNVQKMKIEKGIEILRNQGIYPKVWVAPSHTFDENTLRALKDKSEIDTISDGIALYPYIYKDFKWVPQQLWHFRRMPLGIWTCCFHPGTITSKEFIRVSDFIKKNHNHFISLDNITHYNTKRSLLDIIIYKLFYKILHFKKGRFGD